MIRTRYALPIAALVLFGTFFSARSPLLAQEPENAPAKSEDEFSGQPTWSAPTAAAVRAEVFHWLDERKVEPAVRQRAEALWVPTAGPAPTELLERVVNTIALADARVAPLVDLCSKPKSAAVLPQFPWLTDKETSPLERNNLRLWYGRWLSQERMYDESQAQLAGLEPADVVDPASLLFYQGVAYHWLLNKESGLKTLNRLLEQRNHIPRRYEQLARLMQADMSGLKVDSLDHISRRMKDVTRHLELGRTGKKVRGIEDGIIVSLDKMIDKMEQQQRDAAAAAAQAMGPGGRQSSSPAPDSAPLQGKGPGEVTRKNIGHQAGWGDLPPKEREEALQEIGKEFPSHYRDVIEQYFKRLATEEENK